MMEELCQAWVKLINPQKKVMEIHCDYEDDHSGDHKHMDKYGGEVIWGQ